jgi:hypothetical protein
VIADLLATSTLLLPGVPGVYVGPACHGHPRRPPVSYTEPIKRRLLKSEHLPGDVFDYQLDHLVSLSLGGAPRSLRNLWMQPLRQAHRDDRIEEELYVRVCVRRTLTVRAAMRYEVRWKHRHG